jgi:hypothetical protein
MLRSLVLILIVVNAAFFAWSRGWLNQVIGVQPDAQHEPQRMNLQAHADKIVVVPPAALNDATPRSTAPSPVSANASAASEPDAGASSSLPASEPAGTGASAATASTSNAQNDAQCLEAGPFSSSEYAQVEAAMRPVMPANSWASQSVAIQGLWLVYMGPYADADMLERKQNELRHIKGLNFEEVRTPANLAQGLSLGRYTRQEDADVALNSLRNRGIRTARIVNVRPVMEVQIIRVASATMPMQVSLANLKLPQGKGFAACRP